MLSIRFLFDIFRKAALHEFIDRENMPLIKPRCPTIQGYH
uniref:Uncharacterized protein n=1 Tax=Arundo donax TaxID=35708 RepID=A0A0A9HH11_ARUDO